MKNFYKLFTLLLLLLNTGCTYKNTVAIDSDERGNCKSFLGLADKELFSEDEDIVVFYVHGMGERKYSNEEKTIKFANNVAKEIKFNTNATPKYISIFENKKKNNSIERCYNSVQTCIANGKQLLDLIGDGTILSYNKTSGKQNFIFVSISWSGLMDTIQEQLHNQTNPNPNNIAYLNQEGKKFINHGFGDPVLYMNDMYKKKVHAVIEQVIKEAYSMEYKLEDKKHVLIATSLGSKMVYDIIQENRSKDETFKNFNKNMKQVFMTSNQLALFHQFKVTTTDPCQNNIVLTAIDETIGKDKNNQSEPPVPIIAFTDPNDLLGYYVPAFAYKKECKGKDLTYKNIDFINVMMSNAKIWYAGMLASPITAHTGFKTKEHGYKTIVHGSKYLKFTCIND